MESVVSVTCIEHKGKHERHIYPLVFTPENLKKFWEVSKQFPVLFGKSNVTPDDFKEHFFTERDGEPWLSGVFWVIDDFVGVYYINNIYDEQADAHFSFFDRKLEGREKLTREMLKYVFKKFHTFQRLNVSLPCYVNSKVFQFLRDVGFSAEGRKRSSEFYKGKWFDSVQFGILRSEVLDGE